MTSEPDRRWRDPAVVAEFAAREPDHRLRALFDEAPAPGSIRALDVGCAGGRNAVFLAERGCDVQAIDLSPAMVAETRRRLAEILGDDEATRRVREMPMDDLSAFEDATFDLIVALGIFHQTASVDEWDRAVAECSRVLRAGGRLLVAHFAPGTDLTGNDGRRVSGELDVWELGPGRHAILFNASMLDVRMRAHGFEPIVSSETVKRSREEGGQRVTVNALYRKV